MALLRYLIMSCLILGVSCGNVIAMQFSQPQKIGHMALSQAGDAGGGMVFSGASGNTGDYFRIYNKNNTKSFGKGVARFGNGADALYVHYNAYKEDSATVYCGSQDGNKLIKVWALNNWIYRVSSDEGVTLYPIRFWYGPDSQWNIVGRTKDGKFVKYVDTKEIAIRYFGADKNGEPAQFLIFDMVESRGDTIVLKYSRWRSKNKVDGEFHLKWDEIAQWFSVEHIVR